jgi:hypothetical protein
MQRRVERCDGLPAAVSYRRDGERESLVLGSSRYVLGFGRHAERMLLEIDELEGLWDCVFDRTALKHTHVKLELGLFTLFNGTLEVEQLSRSVDVDVIKNKPHV